MSALRSPEGEAWVLIEVASVLLMYPISAVHPGRCE